MTRFEIVPSTRQLPEGLTPEALQRQLRIAADAWSRECADLDLVVLAPRSTWRVDQDATNLVAFRTERWCKNLQCGHGTTYPTAAAGMTTTFVEDSTPGSVAEADVELNGWSFRYRYGPGDQAITVAHRPDATEIPLQAVLAHELGHLLGLTDVCHPGSPDPCLPPSETTVMDTRLRLTEPTPKDVSAACTLQAEAGIRGRRDEPAPASGATGTSTTGLVTSALSLCALCVAVGWLGFRALGRCRSRRSSAPNRSSSA